MVHDSIRGKCCDGFTYLGLLFAVALAGIALAATGQLWSTERQREREIELLAIGQAFQRAIGSYYEHSPGLVKRYPEKLGDLAKDNRFLTVQRHLRKIPRDPMTGESAWGLVIAPGGGIMGVHSLSNQKTIKQSNFLASNAAFDGAEKYSDWLFIYQCREERNGCPLPR